MPEINHEQRRLLTIRESIASACRVCSGEKSILDCDDTTCELHKWLNLYKQCGHWKIAEVSESVLTFCSHRCGPTFLRCQDMKGDGKTCPLFRAKFNALTGYGKVKA